MSDEQKKAELIKYYKNKSLVERRKYAKKTVATKKTPSVFEYDEQGNLVERKNGEVVKTIPLPTYREPTLPEMAEIEQQRKDDIELATKEFDDIRMLLHEEYQKEEPSEYEIYRLNQEVMLADLRLQKVRFPVQTITKDKSITIRQLDFSQPNEVRKYPYEVAISQSSPFHLVDQYVRIGEPGSRPFVSITEAKKALAGQVIVFDNVNPDAQGYGYLSLNWPVQIEIEGTMYPSARHAIFGELAKSFNDEEHHQAIMKAERPQDVHYTIEDVPEIANQNNNERETTLQEWETTLEDLIEIVNVYKFIQYPELGGRLLETQDAKIGAYEPDDTLFGTGVPLDHPKAKNPIYWTGKNLQGNALMLARDALRHQMQQKQEETVVSPKKSVKKKPDSVPSAPIPSESIPSESIASESIASESIPLEPAPVVPVEAAPVSSTRPRRFVKMAKSANPANPQ